MNRIAMPLALAVLLLAGCGARTQRPRLPAPPPAPAPVPEASPEPSPPAEPSAPPESRPPSLRKILSLPAPDALPIPVDGVDAAELAGSYHAPRSGGRRHQAIDIFAPRNTPVRATISGYVCCRGMRGLGGKTISVIGPGGHRHYYAHLEAWAGFDDGDFVAPGDVLGYVGNSGNARGGPTHLHYAIYRDHAEPLDPYPLMRQGPGAFERSSAE